MLGYIKTQRDDLRICDFRLYKQQYYALCQGIGKKYGIVYRLILSYDMVFFIVVQLSRQKSKTFIMNW